MRTKLEFFGTTDIGRKRASNQDQFLIAELCRSLRIHHTSLPLDHQTQLFGASEGQLMVVADGMGGHEAGERASQLALDGVVDYFLNTMVPLLADPVAFENDLKACLHHCQKLIFDDAEVVPQRKGMGTTLTLAYIVWPRLYLVHVGDSRCYLIRDHRIQQLTRDHTVASTLYPAPLEQDESLPDREGPFTNVLWNVLGGEGQLKPEALSITLAPEDVIVLCTDGLTKYISRKRLREVFAEDQQLSQVCQSVVAEANTAGGADNITLVVCRCNLQQEASLQAEATEIPVEVPDTEVA